MDLGLGLLLFMVVMLLVSIAPLNKWQLKKSSPLDDDELFWPAAGYGSASISLNALFGAYTAALVLVGTACFVGTVAGVLIALFVLNLKVPPRRASRPSFQSFLYGMTCFRSPVVNNLFLVLVAFSQAGLAVSEMVLLHHVFGSGLGLTYAQAFAASLLVACVAYYYCMIGGYKAVFRTDAVQYIFLILMAAIMFYLALEIDLESGARVATQALDVFPSILRENSGIRLMTEVGAGIALGAMPVLAAPDAWKRVFIVKSRDDDARPFVQRLAMVRLFMATAVPLGLVAPLAVDLARNPSVDPWSFPLTAIVASGQGSTLVVLGLVAAFMSTFDGATVSSVHVLMGLKTSLVSPSPHELARYRILLGALFLLISGTFWHVMRAVPNPYAVGGFLVGPFAVVAGVVLGTGLGTRRVTGELFPYLLATFAMGWLYLSFTYMTDPAAPRNPAAAAPLVLTGCAGFFFFGACSFLLSQPQVDLEVERDRPVGRSNRNGA